MSREYKTVTEVRCDHCDKEIEGTPVVIKEARALLPNGTSYWNDLDLHPTCYMKLCEFLGMEPDL